MTSWLVVLAAIFFAVLLAGAFPGRGPIWHDEGNDDP